MTAEAAVIQRLLSIGAVTAIVGTRVHLAKLPQSPTLPAIRVQVIDEQDESHLRGGGGPGRTRVQVDGIVPEAGIGDPYLRVQTLTDAITGNGAGSGLSGWTGTIGAIRIDGIRFVDRAVQYDGVDRELRVRMDFFVLWKLA